MNTVVVNFRIVGPDGEWVFRTRQNVDTFDNFGNRETVGFLVDGGGAWIDTDIGQDVDIDGTI